MHVALATSCNQTIRTDPAYWNVVPPSGAKSRIEKKATIRAPTVGAGFAVFLLCLHCGPEIWSPTWISKTEQDVHAVQTMMHVALSFHVGPCPHIHAPHTVRQSFPRPFQERMSQRTGQCHAEIVTEQSTTELLVHADWQHFDSHSTRDLVHGT